jgi:hypothetical protein
MMPLPLQEVFFSSFNYQWTRIPPSTQSLFYSEQALWRAPWVKRVAVNRTRRKAGAIMLLCIFPANRNKKESRRADSNR